MIPRMGLYRPGGGRAPVAVLHGTVLRAAPPRPRLVQRLSSSSSRRCLSSLAADTPRPRIFTSISDDPYLNLSIEHHLLQHSHPDSTILFLYRNRPCVVIGRNQNPWLEVNLRLLRRGLPAAASDQKEEQEKKDDNSDAPHQVSLVRRRSGGGAVFHDEGNVNWSVICPPAAFERSKHAEMVVRALHALGATGTRVNARHDIVQDVATSSAPDGLSTFKVTGSAYKLTRLRSLHHGTCLLASPNLGHISPLLRSPAAPLIKARGVDSVRSAIRNVGVSPADFPAAVAAEFRSMYGMATTPPEDVAMVGPAALDEHPDVRKGFEELQSPEWIFGQTPLFTFSTHPTEDDPRPRPALPASLPRDFRAFLSVRQGVILDASFSGLAHQDPSVAHALVGQTLYRIADWHEALGQQKQSRAASAESEAASSWLNGLLNVQNLGVRF